MNAVRCWTISCAHLVYILTSLMLCSCALLANPVSSGISTNDSENNFWVKSGSLDPVDLRIPWNGETNKISELYETETRFRGTCTSGLSVYIYDASTEEVLISGDCLSSAFDITVDFSAYDEGSVTVMLTQVDSTFDTSSSPVTITLEKETTFCKNPTNTAATPVGGGADPYLICTIDQFRNVFVNGNAADSFELKNDLDATGVTDLDERMDGPAFSGTLVGNYFGIYNYTNDTRLIGEIDGGSVSFLKFRDVDMNFVANNAVVGDLTFPGADVYIQGVSVHGTINSTNVTAGLIYDSNGGVGDIFILDCWVDLDISAPGIFGLMQSVIGNLSITDSFSRGTFDSSDNVAGILGNAGGGTTTLNRVHSSATLISQANATAGLVGSNQTGVLVVNDSYFDGPSMSSVNAYVGGILAWGPGDVTINRSYVETDLISLPSPTDCGRGGLIGRLDGGNATIDLSYFSGNITGPNCLAGLVGTGGTTVTITDSYATGTIIDLGAGVCGGLVSYSLGGHSISTSYSDMEINCNWQDAMDYDANGAYTNTFHNSDLTSTTNGSSSPLTTLQFSGMSNLALHQRTGHGSFVKIFVDLTRT